MSSCSANLKQPTIMPLPTEVRIFKCEDILTTADPKILRFRQELTFTRDMDGTTVSTITKSMIIAYSQCAKRSTMTQLHSSPLITPSDIRYMRRILRTRPPNSERTRNDGAPKPLLPARIIGHMRGWGRPAYFHVSLHDGWTGIPTNTPKMQMTKSQNSCCTWFSTLPICAHSIYILTTQSRHIPYSNLFEDGHTTEVLRSTLRSLDELKLTVFGPLVALKDFRNGIAQANE